MEKHVLNHLKRSEFTDRTILTIAHRIDTIIDYDRILVMENGRLIEDGTPYNLVMNKQSTFYKMIVENKDSAALIQAASSRIEIMK